MADSDDLVGKVRVAFHDAFGTAPESVTMESTPDDIAGWDSLGHVQLASHLERIFALSFSVDELMDMQDVASIVRILRGHP